MTLFNESIQLLLPQMNDYDARRALIESALYGCPVLEQIKWEGAARPFTTLLVRKLLDYGDVTPGKPALVALLEEVKTQVGIDRQAQIARLIQELSSPEYTTKGRNMAVESGILIGFLLEVGRWAKSELSEKWKVRREQQETSLTDKDQVETTLPKQIETIVRETSPSEVEGIIALIKRKRDAIDRARNAKLADREEYDQQRLAKSAFEQREREHNRTIQQMMDEIEVDLNELGFDVEREPA